MKYQRIVFMQGDDAQETLDILDNNGREDALNHLMQWDYGDKSELFDDSASGRNDRTFEKDNYIMSYNTSLGYIGLEKKVR